MAPKQTKTVETGSSEAQKPAPQKLSKVTGRATDEATVSTTAFQNMQRAVQALLEIEKHCELNIDPSKDEEKAKSKDLDDRVGTLLEESRTRAKNLETTAKNLEDLTTVQDAFIENILKLIRAAQPVKPTPKPETNSAAEEKAQQIGEVSESTKTGSSIVENKPEEITRQPTTESAEVKPTEQPAIENQAVESPKEPSPVVQEVKTQPTATAEQESQKKHKIDVVTQELQDLLQRLKDAQSLLFKELMDTIRQALGNPASTGEGTMDIARQDLNSLVELLERFRGEIKGGKEKLSVFHIECGEKTLIGEGIETLGSRFQEKVGALDAAKLSLVKYITDYDDKATSLADGIERLGNELGNQKDALKSAKDALKSAEDALGEVNTKSKISVEDTRDAEARLPSGIRRLGEALVEKDNQLSKAKADASEFEGALNDAKTTLTTAAKGAYKPETSSLVAGIVALGTALSNALAENAQLTGTVNTLKGDLERLRNANGSVNPSPAPKPAVAPRNQVFKAKPFVNETAKDAVLAFHADFEEVKRLNPKISDSAWAEMGGQSTWADKGDQSTCFWLPSKNRRRVLQLKSADASTPKTANAIARFLNIEPDRFVSDNGEWVRQRENLTGEIVIISAAGPYSWPQA